MSLLDPLIDRDVPWGGGAAGHACASPLLFHTLCDSCRWWLRPSAGSSPVQPEKRGFCLRLHSQHPPTGGEVETEQHQRPRQMLAGTSRSNSSPPAGRFGWLFFYYANLSVNVAQHLKVSGSSVCPESCLTSQEAIAWSVWPEMTVCKYRCISHGVCFLADSGLLLLQTLSMQ